ncbi:7430_t:CDS:2, partial [Dentiscutata heterogama]
TPWYDGSVGSSQCGIPPKGTFTYNFTTDQVGTYWYHSHYPGQYIDGIYGAFIIHDPEDPYLDEYDEEYIVILSDWFYLERIFLERLYFEAHYVEPNPNNGLINGKNKIDCKMLSPDISCNGGEYSKFTFMPRKRYRLRIINTSTQAAFFFSIDNHILDVIEIEGGYIEKYTLTTVPVNTGQRYSVIVKADQEISNHWMRSAFDYTVYLIKPQTAKLYNNAIVHYEGAEEKEPTTQYWSDSVMSEWKDLEKLVNLKPYYYEPLPPNDLTILLIAHFDFTEGYINGSKYVPDYKISTLNKIYQGVQEFDADQNVLTFTQPGQVIDVIVYNVNNKEHPFHMHGHKFWVLGTFKYNFTDTVPDPATLPLKNKAMNLVNPIKRDTTTLISGWIVIRFVIDNPGVWSFHCHTEWHVLSGMTVQILELPNDITKLNPPQDWIDLCNNSTADFGNSNMSPEFISDI